MSRKAGNLYDRFWSKVDKTTTPDGCWTWTACKAKDPKHAYGYIGMKVDGSWKRIAAHRVVYEMIENHKIPKGKLICHSCNNPSCVRPDHLYLGTKLTNIMDCIRAGQQNILKGEDSPNSTLTEAQVRDIRNLYSSRIGHYRQASVSQRKLAAKYGVSRATIRAVIAHKTYKEEHK